MLLPVVGFYIGSGEGKGNEVQNANLRPTNALRIPEHVRSRIFLFALILLSTAGVLEINGTVITTNWDDVHVHSDAF